MFGIRQAHCFDGGPRCNLLPVCLSVQLLVVSFFVSAQWTFQNIIFSSSQSCSFSIVVHNQSGGLQLGLCSLSNLSGFSIIVVSL